MVDAEGKQLVEACVAGDASARERFQTAYLRLIYRFEGGGSEHEGASQNFLDFLFDNDRLYRRLQSYRGAAPLPAYLCGCILPDLLKQFRRLIRRQRLDTVSVDGGPDAIASHHSEAERRETSPSNGSSLDGLSTDKRLLLKLLYIEDFDLEPTEIQMLAQRSGRTIRNVLDQIEVARETVRSREAMQHARVASAESAGQWIRLHERRLAEVEDDLAATDAGSPRAARLFAKRADLLRKLDKRQRQRAERLRAGSSTVVTLPTAMVADLLGQRESATRSQITRVRQELAAIVACDGARPGGIHE